MTNCDEEYGGQDGDEDMQNNHDNMATGAVVETIENIEDMTPAEAALTYVRGGLKIFPCNDLKRPMVANGLHAASCEETVVAEWWKKHPNALIGMPTGANGNGIVVIDLDNHDGKDGIGEFAKICGGRRLETRIVETPSGGLHLWFWQPEGIPIKSTAGKIGPGIDTRGDGGYVVIPGSVLPDGRRYTRKRILPPAEMPDWLVAILREKGCTKEPRPATRKTTGPEPADNTPPTAEEIKIRSALAVLDPDLSYDQWRDVGMALKSWDGSDGGRGCALWHEWSSRGDKYEESDAEKHWDSYGPDGGITLGTLYHHAKEAGWEGMTVEEKDRHDALRYGVRVRTVRPGTPREGPLPEIPLRWFDEVREHDPDDMWIVEGIVPRHGLTLVTAPPKAGKSLIAADLAVAVSHGGEWLSRLPVMASGSVIYLCLDQDAETTRKRMRLLGCAPGAAVAVVDMQDMRTMDSGGLEMLSGLVARMQAGGRPPVLVVVDVWADLAPSAVSKKNAYMSDSDSLRRIVQWSSGHRLACCLLHHTGKDGTVSGSVAMVGKATQSIVLEPVGGERRVHGEYVLGVKVAATCKCRLGSDVESFGVDLWFERDKGEDARKVLVYRDGSGTVRSESLKGRILSALSDSASPQAALSIADITDIVNSDGGGQVRKGSVQRAVSRLHLADQAVEKQGRGSYWISDTGFALSASVQPPPDWEVRSIKTELLNTVPCLDVCMSSKCLDENDLDPDKHPDKSRQTDKDGSSSWTRGLRSSAAGQTACLDLSGSLSGSKGLPVNNLEKIQTRTGVCMCGDPSELCGDRYEARLLAFDPFRDHDPDEVFDWEVTPEGKVVVAPPSVLDAMRAAGPALNAESRSGWVGGRWVPPSQQEQLASVRAAEEWVADCLSGRRRHVPRTDLPPTDRRRLLTAAEASSLTSKQWRQRLSGIEPIAVFGDDDCGPMFEEDVWAGVNLAAA